MTRIAKIMLTVLVVTATALLTAGGGDQTPPPPNPLTDYQAYTRRYLQERFPNLPLLTQDNKPVRFYDDVIKGNIVILQFMFANCEEFCPLVTPNLVKVQRELKKRGASEVKMVSITVDPARDTPRALKEYAARFHVQPGWQFLTGSKADIDHIRRELGVWDPDEKKIEHMNVLTIGNETTGQWIAIEGLAKPDDIVQTVLRFTAAGLRGRAGAIASSRNGRDTGE